MALTRTRCRRPGARLLAAALAAASSSALGDPGILLLPAIGRPTQVTVAGRVLRDAPTSGSSTLSKNLRRLAAPSWTGAPVEVRFEGRRARTTSGDDGTFEVSFPAPSDRGFSPGLHPVAAQVPGAAAEASVDVIADGAPFLVISDFDDTVAVSQVTKASGLIASALLEDSDTQPAVAGMAALYRCLRDGKPSSPGFAFVSGSPVQFSGRMQGFFAKNQFPFGGLYLRELGPGTISNYKQPVIRRLLAQLPERVLLFGDSGEHDPEVYAQIRAEFPDRVLDVFIRDVTSGAKPERFEGAVRFTDAADAARIAAGRGYADAACVARSFPPPDAGSPAGPPK